MQFSGKRPNPLWKALPASILHDHPRYIQMEDNTGPTQRSDDWFKKRSDVDFTASQAAGALDFFSPEPAAILGLSDYYIKEDNMMKSYNQMRYNCKYTANAPPFEINSFGRVCMNWGTHHENNAVYSMLTKYPNIRIYETTITNTEKVMKDGGILKYGATPDGEIEILDDKGNTIDRTNYEIKCPAPYFPDPQKQDVFNYFKKPPHENIPVVYIPQIFTQMGCTGRTKTTFQSWTSTCGFNVFGVKFHEDYFNTMLELIYSFLRDSVHRVYHRQLTTI
jgi:hypothetical protein